jgi:hypothetical protein
MHRIAAPRPALKLADPSCFYCDGPVSPRDYATAVCPHHGISLDPRWCCVGCEETLHQELDRMCDRVTAAADYRPPTPFRRRRRR